MKKTLTLLTGIFVIISAMAQIPTTNLVGHWKFEGNANDVSGNNHNGIAQGSLSYDKDRFGNTNSAIVFDGNEANYVEVTDNEDLNFNSSFTYSFWIKRTTAGGVQHIISKGHDVGTGYSYHINNDQQVFRIAAGVKHDVETEVVQVNDWHHIVTSYDAAKKYTYIYVDKKLVDSTFISGDLNLTNDYPLVFGRHFLSKSGAGGYEFAYKGLLDDVYLYNRAISKEEIIALYGDYQPIAYWKFDGDANDASENNHNGTVKGSLSYDKDRFDNTNSAIVFDGNEANYVEVTDNKDLNFNSSFTYSFWIKRTTAGGVQHIISKGHDVGTGYSYHFNNDQQVFRIAAGVKHDVETEVVQVNDWYHIVTSYDAAKKYTYIYVDKKLVDSTFISGDLNLTNDYPLVFGRHFLSKSGTGGYEFAYKGLLDDVYLYNRAISKEEIIALYGDYTKVVTNLSNTEETESVIAYPNPANEKITLNLHTFTGKVDVTITDLYGKEYSQFETNEDQLDLELDIPTGAYIITIVSSEESKTIKIIKN